MLTRILILACGALGYSIFLATFLYAIGFIGNFGAPRTLDGAPTEPLGKALAINVGLLGLFAVQHSVMARKWFKEAWTRAVPRPIERSTQVGRLSAAPGAVRLALVAMLVSCVAAPAALAKSGHQDCGGATITASFADSCRDFTTHSSKNISYVELHYVDGGVVKHKHINSHDWAIDGEPGDEIDFARVKSGTTIEEFACVPTNTAPTALLEIQTPPIDQTLDTCYDFFSGGLLCEQSSPRTAWTSPGQIPDNGGSESGFFHWGCGGLSDPSLCQWTVRFRGTGSSDPDGDIASWSLDFGDGTSASGTWSAPPTEVAHEYAPFGATCTGVVGSNSHVCIVTLTVTDSAGQSDSDAILMVSVDQTPD